MNETTIGNFTIREEVSQGPLGTHWDIYLMGSDDSLITVWDSKETAKVICKSLSRKIELGKASFAGNKMTYRKCRLRKANATRSSLGMEVRV